MTGRFPFLLASLFLFGVLYCGETEGRENENGPSSSKENATLPSLCTVCNCTGETMNCKDRGLENLFAEWQWPNTTAITEASFENNSLLHLQPFPKLPIKKLVLSHNQMTAIENSAFKELVDLTELDLSRNQLTSEVLQPHVFQGRFSPESYEPLAKLRILDLSHNVLHSLHQSLFEHLSNLKVLSLAGNPLRSIDLRTSIAISNLMYLEELDLSYCSLNSLPDVQFRSLRHLKKLNLSSNRFTRIPTALNEAGSLESLYLDENPIVVIDQVHALPALPNLKELSLCCMPDLRTIGRAGLSGSENLQVLRIKNCPNFQEIDEDALVVQTTAGATWPPLRELDLSDNGLRYLPALLLGRWDRLQQLGLINNQWSCDCQNQYLIGSLLPNYGDKLMGQEAGKLFCAAPPEHQGKNLSSLARRKLRCLDLYDARPERDAAVLVGILIGLLLAVPLALALFVFWRRGFFFCGSHGPASFSRAFYKRASNDDDL